MRLDLFLKVSRLIPRRALANEFCKKGLVKVNDKKAKSSYDVREDDKITISRNTEITKVIVRSIPQGKNVSKKDAGSLYEIISDEKIEEGSPFEIKIS